MKWDKGEMFCLGKGFHMHCHTHMYAHTWMHAYAFQLVEPCPSNYTSKTAQPSLEKHDIPSLQCPCQGLGRAWHWLLKTSASVSVGRLCDNVPHSLWLCGFIIQVFAQAVSQISSQWYHGISFLPSKVLMLPGQVFSEEAIVQCRCYSYSSVIVRGIHSIVLETILSFQTDVKFNTGFLSQFCTKPLGLHTFIWWRFIFTLF